MSTAQYYYTNVCQCRYWRDGSYRLGIIYKTSIVDAVDGHPYDLDQIFESARKSGIDDDDVVCEFGTWRDLSSIIAR